MAGAAGGVSLRATHVCCVVLARSVLVPAAHDAKLLNTTVDAAERLVLQSTARLFGAGAFYCRGWFSDGESDWVAGCGACLMSCSHSETLGKSESLVAGRLVACSRTEVSNFLLSSSPSSTPSFISLSMRTSTTIHSRSLSSCPCYATVVALAVLVQ